ncbi:RNA polymerase II elongation factor ELL3 [Sorex fumeus]|uniref:RNA polymerase II elongation factor ELL3 n=1 Tax=Sorex fumeus TaxID=62283 RepID=UPI0024ADD58B|nr:RNA polymerase II elongation factor ELL3 [Sorex fumeus]
MEGPQKFPSGSLRLCFAPAARTSLLLLRLNDAALRALHDCQLQQVRPVIAFQGNRGYLRLPGPGWSCLFSFVLSQCGQELGGGGGSLDLVCQRLGRSAPNLLHCLGPLRERLTICTAMDSTSSVQGSHLHDDRNPESWCSTTDYSGGAAVSQPQVALEEASGSLANSQGQSLPGSSREPMAKWEVRNQIYLPNREPDQTLPSSTSQKHLDKKRPATTAALDQKEKRLRTLHSATSPLQSLSNQDLQEDDDDDDDDEDDDWEEEDKDEDLGPRLGHSPSDQADSESPSPEEVPDYLLQYSTIHSAEQQQAYEQDFETDYAEYRILHARVGAASQRFVELGAEINRVQRGTPEHKVLEEKILQEYKKFRKRYPGYREEKHRCEYLHQKLSHIKGLILEFEEKNRGS